MPRRPHTKNLPSRLYEETTTPIYLIDQRNRIAYANPALAEVVQAERDQMIGCQLKFLAAGSADADHPFSGALCPPPRIWPREVADNEADDVAAIDALANGFRVCLNDGRTYRALCTPLVFSDGTAGLAVHLLPLNAAAEEAVAEDWLHDRVREFRRWQSSRFNAIPYLGDSAAARRCFAQARSYALSESNVSVVGHPGSQRVELAKAIHYSGFTTAEDPDPLLPIDCRQVEGDRIGEIVIGHYHVNVAGDHQERLSILLMNADCLNEIAQRDLRMLGDEQRVNLRILSTSRRPLLELDGFDTALACSLSTLELVIPDLSSRREDAPFLAQVLLEAEESPASLLAPDLVRGLQVYSWNDDYQELAEMIRQASRTCQGAEIRLGDCPHDFRMALKALENPLPKMESLDLDRLLDEVEQEALRRAIRQSGGNKTNAARMLGITRARLHRKLAEMNESSEDGDADVDH